MQAPTPPLTHEEQQREAETTPEVIEALGVIAEGEWRRTRTVNRTMELARGHYARGAIEAVLAKCTGPQVPVLEAELVEGMFRNAEKMGPQLRGAIQYAIDQEMMCQPANPGIANLARAYCKAGNEAEDYNEKMYMAEAMAVVGNRRCGEHASDALRCIARPYDEHERESAKGRKVYGGRGGAKIATGCDVAYRIDRMMRYLDPDANGEEAAEPIIRTTIEAGGWIPKQCRDTILAACACRCLPGNPQTAVQGARAISDPAIRAWTMGSIEDAGGPVLVADVVRCLDEIEKPAQWRAILGLLARMELRSEGSATMAYELAAQSESVDLLDRYTNLSRIMETAVEVGIIRVWMHRKWRAEALKFIDDRIDETTIGHIAREANTILATVMAKRSKDADPTSHELMKAIREVAVQARRVCGADMETPGEVLREMTWMQVRMELIGSPGEPLEQQKQNWMCVLEYWKRAVDKGSDPLDADSIPHPPSGQAWDAIMKAVEHSMGRQKKLEVVIPGLGGWMLRSETRPFEARLEDVFRMSEAKVNRNRTTMLAKAIERGIGPAE